MCGIAGVFGERVGLDPSVIRGVQRMTAAQLHRGPDDEGSLQRRDLVFGHRRLSIVDLSSSGKQPMSNESGNIWVVYNGEIYNHQELRQDLQNQGHRFASLSDTEVLLHGYEEWGIEGLLQRLRGMFAFALYDDQAKTTQGRNSASLFFLARDRLGIKPLYYAFLQDRHCLVFASEVRAFHQSGLVPLDEDPQAWLAFLLFGSIPTPWTTVRAVRSLPPGHYLVTNGSGPRFVQYHSIDALFAGSTPSDESKPNERNRLNDLEGELRARLAETVALHLISDVPVGVFLSGGIDSSALVALATSCQQELITLGVVFEGDPLSEESYQRAVARRFGSQHLSVPVTLKEFQDALERFIEFMDQPTVDGLNTYFVSRAAQLAGLKAVLSGIGGDEVFCGYPTLRRAASLWRLRSLPAPLLMAAIAVGKLRPSLRKLGFLKHPGSLPFYLVQRGLFTPQEAAQLLGAEEREAWALIESLEPSQAPRDPVLLQQFLEARHYLVDQLLKDADVFSMAHSVEVRVPFLDHLLLERVLKAPLGWRLDRRWPKPLLTKTLRNLLPAEVIFRPKQGFTLPMEVWLRSSDGMFRDGGSGLNAAAYRAARKAFLSGRAHWSRPWALAVLASTRR